ncbi:RagB/SusD family nutrient uptake outer membrane protein [Rufibacter sediminis]|uniref:RagB/SusD family nutrient uptake outer membrane protein n=1 Tax=Rufibacter sediminis TaxID=2762756 RepID=A0ABR6VWA0_9BACT|nr:RagB/SusD family nutrient uptake outer membrane protein [Rufibacter sediminis]MBC3541471.1 RagB/SusD family nutrient uptake outer membrane protein [Rufibacter sediminis]
MKRKNIKAYVVILGFASLLFSCNDQLDIDPQQSVETGQALATSSDVEAALVGAYDAAGDADVYGGDIQFLSDLLANNGDIAFVGTFAQPGQVYDKVILENNSFIANTWLDSYRVINIANSVLANISKVDEAKKARVEGEAKFLRGSIYFELIKLYGKAWVDGNPATNPGVPLVLEPTNIINEASFVSRNSVAEIYAQILKDLTEAEALLPPTNGFFATKGAAAGMLSRVFLQQEKFLDAGDAADRVIKSGRYRLTDTYAQAFNNTGNSSEDIFAIQVTSQDGINELNTYYSQLQRGDVEIQDKLINQYEAGDERLGIYEDEYTNKFDEQFAVVPVLRLAEMYLTRAEASLRTGTNIGGVSAVADINTIRERAGLEPVTTVTLPQVLQERKLELIFEGQLLHDIKRTKGAVGTFPYNANNLVFPVPQRERDANPNLTQNPGYLGG